MLGKGPKSPTQRESRPSKGARKKETKSSTPREREKSRSANEKESSKSKNNSSGEEDIEVLNSDEEKEDAPKGSGSGSMFFKIKKRMASSTANSGMGRRVVGHFLGAEGNRLMHGLKSAMRRDVGKVQARTYRNLILKFALKGKVLSDQNLVRKKDVWKMGEPMNSLGLKLYAFLKPQAIVNPGDPPKVLDLAPLMVEVVVIKKMTLHLLGHHVRDKNRKSLEDLLDYIGGEHFLGLLVNDPNYEQEKVLMFDSIRKLMQPVLEERTFNDDMVQVCDEDKCESFCLLRYGDFAGTNKCAKHYKFAYEQFVKSPDVEHFLSGPGSNYFPFQEQAKDKIDRYARKILLLARKYRDQSDGTRPIMAQMIWDKYNLDERDKWRSLPAGLADRLRARLRSGDKELFKELESVLQAKFDEFFATDNTGFLHSKDFTDYVEKYYKAPTFLTKTFEKD